MAERLRALKALGVRLAIDDFGTGFSSLSYLQHLPVDVIKIDRSFIDGLGRPDARATLATTVVKLSETLGMTTVAEGVETTDQLQALQAMACEFAQGYLFAKPLEATAAMAYVQGTSRDAPAVARERGPLAPVH